MSLFEYPSYEVFRMCDAKRMAIYEQYENELADLNKWDTGWFRRWRIGHAWKLEILNSWKSYNLDRMYGILDAAQYGATRCLLSLSDVVWLNQ